jgi:hypothetical protein
MCGQSCHLCLAVCAACSGLVASSGRCAMHKLHFFLVCWTSSCKESRWCWSRSSGPPSVRREESSIRASRPRVWRATPRSRVKIVCPSAGGRPEKVREIRGTRGGSGAGAPWCISMPVRRISSADRAMVPVLAQVRMSAGGHHEAGPGELRGGQRQGSRWPWSWDRSDIHRPTRARRPWRPAQAVASAWCPGLRWPQAPQHGWASRSRATHLRCLEVWRPVAAGRNARRQ